MQSRQNIVNNVIVKKMEIFIQLSDCFVECLYSQFACISCLALLMNATLFSMSLAVG